MLAISARYVVLEDLKMHGSIVYFDISMQLWSWKTWNFTDLLQFYCYTVMSWSCNGSFLTVMKLDGSCNGCYLS